MNIQKQVFSRYELTPLFVWFCALADGGIGLDRALDVPHSV